MDDAWRGDGDGGGERTRRALGLFESTEVRFSFAIAWPSSDTGRSLSRMPSLPGDGRGRVLAGGAETEAGDSTIDGDGSGDVGDVGNGANWRRGSSCMSQRMPKSAALGFFCGEGPAADADVLT